MAKYLVVYSYTDLTKRGQRISCEVVRDVEGVVYHDNSIGMYEQLDLHKIAREEYNFLIDSINALES